MKKRRYFAGAAAILFLLLLCGFAPQSITEDKDAQVLLYETYGESEILVYTGRTTVLYRPDGRSAEAPFNGQYAVLHGDTVTVFAETEEFLAVERFSAETLEETDLFALPVTSGLRFAESDSAGRLYAVTYGAPSTLQVFDAAGEPLTEFIFEDKIFGIQTVDSTLYVLLSESAVQISLAGNVPTLSGTAFTYAPAARPYKLLGSDVYVNMQGEVRLFSGEEWAEDTIVTEAVLSGDMLYWLSDTSEVSRVRPRRQGGVIHAFRRSGCTHRKCSDHLAKRRTVQRVVRYICAALRPHLRPSRHLRRSRPRPQSPLKRRSRRLPQNRARRRSQRLHRNRPPRRIRMSRRSCVFPATFYTQNRALRQQSYGQHSHRRKWKCTRHPPQRPPVG